jgi:hypothetical protein
MPAALRLALVAALFALSPTATLRAETVMNWRAPANWPAYVTAIQFGNQRLSGNNPVRFGSWTVRFENNSSTIVQYAARPEMANVFAWGFICSNSVVGAKQCGMAFGTAGSLDGKCSVNSNEGEGGDFWSFEVPCPSSMDMAR